MVILSGLTGRCDVPATISDARSHRRSSWRKGTSSVTSPGVMSTRGSLPHPALGLVRVDW
jgi:hypothetical protein